MPYVKQITIRKTLNRSLKYIVNDKKTDYGCLVTGVNCASNDRLAYKQMIGNKKKFNKEAGTLGFHFIQSFKEKEISDPYRAHEVGLKWAEKMFGDKYQFIISTHMDKGHYHNHIIINSVALDGRKFNACKQSLQDARDFSDEVAREYNLSIIPFNEKSVPKSYKEWNEEKKGTSWKAHIRADIDAVIKESKSFDEFMIKMERLGYIMKQGHVKYMTFKAPGMERSVRGKTLGPEYTEERIKERLTLQRFNFNDAATKFKYQFRHSTSRKQLRDAAQQYKYRRGSLAVNFILAIALIRTLANRNAADREGNYRVRRNFSADIEISKLTNQLKFITDLGLKSKDDLKNLEADTRNQIKNITSIIKDAEQSRQTLYLAYRSIETFNKYKPFYEEYQAASLKKVLLKKKYHSELETFQKAKIQLEKMGINESEHNEYRKNLENYDTKIVQLKNRLESEKGKLSKLAEVENSLKRRSTMLLSASTRNRPPRETER
ncbi:relaxase/mobilization nuclease domain-containing protein [Paenibacillus tuaregi]|uniref:relaxase/mobilization nuclease domain-containing protein n=1 Tax=Paenibacillus tuaregi TaxID=1816681 RepID=UPI00083855B7|nr:relaxase/mobilization nuclease domain-containing protein [Paenibacillus tuaregi]